MRADETTATAADATIDVVSFFLVASPLVVSDSGCLVVRTLEVLHSQDLCLKDIGSQPLAFFSVC